MDGGDEWVVVVEELRRWVLRVEDLWFLDWEVRVGECLSDVVDASEASSGPATREYS